MLKFLLFVFAVLASFGAKAQELVKDINATPGSQPAAENPFGPYCAPCGSYLFFYAKEPEHGLEVWRTDGTENGTIRLTDFITTAVVESAPPQILCHNNKAIFPGTGGYYQSDGTVAGTKIAAASAVVDIAIHNDNLIYTSGRGIYQVSLNGTTPFGTLLKQFTVAATDSFWGIDLEVSNGKLYYAFMTRNNTTTWYNFELGVYDGANFTVLQSYTAPVFYMESFLTAFNGLVVFRGFDSTNGEELWVSDGTAGGTLMLANMHADITASVPRPVRIINNTLVIHTFQPTATWITDGTVLGTKKAIDGFEPRMTRQLNNKIYIYGGQSGNGYRLAQLDLDFTNLQYVSPTGIQTPSYGMAVSGGKVLIGHKSTDFGIELFGYDPVANSFDIIKDINPGPNNSTPGAFIEFGSNAYLLADDGVHGHELWKTNGTDAGTVIVKDINVATAAAEIDQIYTYNNKLYFMARRSLTSGLDIWKTDGTTAGTQLLYDAGQYASWMTGAGKYVVTNSQGFYKIDVETGATTMFLSGPGGFGFGKPRSRIVVGNNAYEFLSLQFAGDPDAGREVWRINPTTNEVALVKDINPGLDGSGGSIITGVALGNKIIFSAISPDGTEPWVSDGTTGGTMLLKNIHPTEGSYPNGFVVMNGKAYFYATSPDEGTELWETDGTPTGTRLVIDLYPGASSGFVGITMAAVGNKLFFAGRDAATDPGSNLWASDGTAQGTAVFKDLRSMGWNSTGNFITSGNKVYFSAEKSGTGVEVWFTDGTPEGTQFVETSVGIGTSLQKPLAKDGGLYFIKEGQLWRTLGTQQTTKALGPANPTSELYLTENHVVFLQDDIVYGKELFRYALAAKENQTITFPNLPAKLVTDAPFNANATASSGLPVEYTSSDETVATISSTGLITIHAAGSTSITATQSGDENFNPTSSPVTRVLVVDKVSQTITINSFGSKKISDPPFQLVASTTSGLPLAYSSSDETVATISSTGLITIEKAGQTVITVSQGGSDTYHPSSKTIQLEVGRTSQTITFPALPGKTFGDGPFQAQATASSGLPVVYTSANPQIAEVTQSGEITIVKAGVTQITALQSGDDNYSAATPVIRDIVINKASQTVTFEALPTVLASDDDFFIEAESSSGLPLTLTSSDESVATVSGDGKISILAAGTTRITAVQLGGDNYNASTPVVRTLVVKEKGQTITLIPINDKVATDDPFFATAFSSSGLPITFASFDPTIASISSSGLITLLSAGTATIIATQEGNDAFAAADPVTVTFKITKASQEITFPAIVSVADGSGPFGLNATASSGLAVVYKVAPSTEATIVVNGNIATSSGVGHATIIATQPGNSKYAAANDVSITFCVNPKRPIITVTNFAEQSTLRSSATINNTWTFNGDPMGLTTQEITVKKDGVYKVRTSQFNCNSDFSEGANVVITGIEETEEVSLFPNPASKTLIIKSYIASMQIMDTFGRIHHDQKLNAGETQVDVSSLSAGVYFVVIDNTHRLKFVKQ